MSQCLIKVLVWALLAFIWLYRDTGDTTKVAAPSADIFWLVLPSLVLFVLLPILLKQGWNFSFPRESGSRPLGVYE